jgi:hypothetical protein
LLKKYQIPNKKIITFMEKVFTFDSCCAIMDIMDKCGHTSALNYVPAPKTHDDKEKYQ